MFERLVLLFVIVMVFLFCGQTQAAAIDPNWAGSEWVSESESLNSHVLRFFLDPNLVGGMSTPELKSNISQYAVEINDLFAKQTTRRMIFDPNSGITITPTQPHTNSAGVLPEEGYELWVHAVLTDNPTYGTYGGNMGFDISGAGVAGGLRWDAIHNPSALVDASEELQQYWRQIDHIVHEFEHVFGAGSGEYYGLAYVDDATGIEPVADIDKEPTNSFWRLRQDYFTDPLLNNIWNNWLVGSPTSLADLRDTVMFADVTVAIGDRGPRQSASSIATLPDLSQVKVQVRDARTKELIANSTTRVWNVRSFSPYYSEELSVTATAPPGEFWFDWPPYPSISVFSNYRHLKLIKAFANDYISETVWISLYDAVEQKMIYGSDEMIIPVYLMPQDGTYTVNLTDFAMLSLAWLSQDDQPEYDKNCDFNTDGIIGPADLRTIAVGWLAEP